MTDNQIITLTLSVVGIMILIPAAIRTFEEKYLKKKMTYLGIATVCHILSLGLRMSYTLMGYAGLRIPFANASPIIRIVVLTIDIVSVGFFLFIVIIGDNGELSLKGRKSILDFPILIAAAVPSAVAVILYFIFPGIDYLAFSYVISLHLALLILSNRTEKIMEKKNIELKEEISKKLARQMRPHFTFNALMGIEELCYENGEAAAEGIRNISGYVRSNIYSITQDRMIPFESELKHIEQYVALEKIDPGRNFDVIYDIKISDFNIPALSVEPVVELAVQHGAVARGDGEGKVCLKTEEKNGEIIITIRDNGSYSEETLEHIEKYHKGISLDNVKETIEEECSGTLEAHYSSEGAAVIIHIPKGDK
jgi:hypothetical protein